MTYVITAPCIDVKDKGCVEECPVDCIYEGERMLYIHPDECVDCGACEPVCPVEAIYYEDDIPEQWKQYHQINSDFFDGLGSPGGASKIGAVLPDKIIGTVREPPPFSLPQLPELAYDGIVREFAGIDPPQRGSIALIDETSSTLIGVLLLFHDRVIVLSDHTRRLQLADPLKRLRDEGLVEFSPIDAWVAEVADSLLDSCNALSSGREVSDWDAWSLARHQGNLPLFGRLWVAAEKPPFRAGPRHWDRDTYDLAWFLLPQVIQFVAQQRGLAIDYAKSGMWNFPRTWIPNQIKARREISDFERVACNILPMSPSDVRAFRTEYGELFRAQMALVRRCLREAAASPHSVEGRYDTAEAASRLAESSYRLYVATRELPHADHGSWSMGAICETGLSPAPLGTPLVAAAASPITEVFSWVLSSARVPRWEHKRGA
jgi:ferredoxin